MGSGPEEESRLSRSIPRLRETGHDYPALGEAGIAARQIVTYNTFTWSAAVPYAGMALGVKIWEDVRYPNAKRFSIVYDLGTGYVKSVLRYFICVNRLCDRATLLRVLALRRK